MHRKIVFLFGIILFLPVLIHTSNFKTNNVENKYFKKIDIKMKDNIEQNIHFGFSHTTGNIQSLNLNAKYDIALLIPGYNNKDLKFMLSSSIYFSETEEIKSNEEYQVDVGFEQSLSHKWLTYISAHWFRNPQFKNLNHRLSLNLGIGNEIFNNNNQTLKFKIGMAHNIENYYSNENTKTYKSMNEYIEYTNHINTHTNVSVRLGSMQNISNFSTDYELLGVVGIEVKITKNLNIRVEEEVYYKSLPSVGVEKTDTKSLISIGYNF